MQTIINGPCGPGELICAIDELPCGRTSFKVDTDGGAKRIDVDKNAVEMFVTIWDADARSRLDASADRHSFLVPCFKRKTFVDHLRLERYLKLRHVEQAAEIERAQQVIRDNNDLL